MTESYLIPAARQRNTQTIKRSRFIATLAHTPGVVEAKAFIAQIKSEFGDASHNCWAYQIGPPGDTARIGMNDDGEVRQTAGRPMLNVLIHSGMGEITAVVTRYYGGTNLGTGGLIRAYSGTLKMALDLAPKVEKRNLIALRLKFAYTHLNNIQAICRHFDAIVVAQHFGHAVELLLQIPLEHQTPLIAKLNGLTAGEIEFCGNSEG